MPARGSGGDLLLRPGTVCPIYVVAYLLSLRISLSKWNWRFYFECFYLVVKYSICLKSVSRD